MAKYLLSRQLQAPHRYGAGATEADESAVCESNILHI